MQTVADIVERVKALTLEEMEEIEIIIHKTIFEKKRWKFFRIRKKVKIIIRMAN